MPFFFYDWTFLLLIPVLLLAMWAQSQVRGNYNRFRAVASSTGFTGAQAARRILDRHGLTNVDEIGRASCRERVFRTV